MKTLQQFKEGLAMDGEGTGQGSSAEEGGQGGRGGAQGGTMSGLDPRAETAPDGLTQETWVMSWLRALA